MRGIVRSVSESERKRGTEGGGIGKERRGGKEKGKDWGARGAHLAVFGREAVGANLFDHLSQSTAKKNHVTQ